MTFEEALCLMRDGRRVRRAGWWDGISSTRMGVHLEARDLFATDWEEFIDPVDLAALWEAQANDTQGYHPAASAMLRRCAHELRALHPVAEHLLPTVAEIREHIRVLADRATFQGMTERAMMLRRLGEALDLADDRKAG